MPETMGLRKMSLRRSLWRARLATKALGDATHLSESEIHATALLRAAIKQHLTHEPEAGDGVCEVYHVETPWQAEVLKNDPDIFYASTVRELAAMLAEPQTLKVLASREAYAEFDRLKALCRREQGDETEFKTVFVDFA